VDPDRRVIDVPQADHLEGVPASTSARRIPHTPAPDGIAPTPVSQLDNTASLVLTIEPTSRRS
jgi:hypothetical protein